MSFENKVLAVKEHPGIPKILLISVEEHFSNAIPEVFAQDRYTILRSDTQENAMLVLKNDPVDVVLLDIEKGMFQEIDIISFIKSHSPNTEIIILTTVDLLTIAMQGINNGAAFYLVKPVQPVDLKPLVDKLCFKALRGIELQDVEQQLFTDFMAGNQAMMKLLKLAAKIAPTSSTVLIDGESGTGKEFFARLIHRMSGKHEANFVAVNCGAIPEQLFESEFFGHKKGSFTGADRDKQGLVEEAHAGALFLDEIGELSPAAQVKLLRFLQEKTFRRVGETMVRSVNVRVIAATNKYLPRLVEAGTFREDLYYRLNVFYLHLPPLRERKETIPNLIRVFAHRYNVMYDKQIMRISKTAEVLLAGYDYPGNIRELENIIEHAIVLADGQEITEKELPDSVNRKPLMLTGPKQQGSEFPALVEMEKQHIEAALHRFKFNYGIAAEKLGISRATLWRKIKEYNIAKQ
jgi:two-component system nitrogen regulation response regulator GlnG/two-component system response regulator HydG